MSFLLLLLIQVKRSAVYVQCPQSLIQRGEKPLAGEGVAGSMHPARGLFMLNRGGHTHSNIKQNGPGGTSRPLSGVLKPQGRNSPLKGRLSSQETLDGPHSNSISSSCVPTWSTFLHCSLRGPSQTRACRERVEGSIPPRAGPCKAGASSSLSRPWPAKPGVRGKTASRVPSLDASLAAAPVGSGLGPEVSWREARFLILCVSTVNLCAAGWLRGRSLSPSPQG